MPLLTNFLIPFRRDKKRDFATGSADALLASKVRQVLLTDGSTPRSVGELPWRTNFGAGLDLLRHQRNNTVLIELARVRVRDALQRWIPTAEILAIDPVSADDVLSIRVRVRERAVAATVLVPL